MLSVISCRSEVGPLDTRGVARGFSARGETDNLVPPLLNITNLVSSFGAPDDLPLRQCWMQACYVARRSI